MKKLFTLIAMVLVLTMMPFALFSCDDETRVSKRGSKDTSDSSTDDSNGDSTPDNTDDGKDDGKTENNGGETDDSKENVLKLARNTDKVKLLGRTQTLSTGLAVDHTASGIEVKGNFVGDVKLKLRTAIVKSTCDKTYFTVYVDGVRQSERIAIDTPAIKTITLASFATKGEHTIRIVKQTENNYTLAEFIELSYRGSLLTPPANSLTYIEFIGDSLTCGMGNLPAANGTYPQDANIAQTSPYEDGTQSYGYIAAEKLGADYSIISESGIGLSASWDDPMPAFYTASSYNRDSKTQYSFDRVPNLIVINLGTNDYYINSDSGLSQSSNATPAKFKVKVKEFISTVRDAYGKDVPIIWVSRFVGIGDQHVAAIDSAISELGGESAGLYRLDVTKNTGGAQGHPTVAGHQTAAEELVAYIDSKALLEVEKHSSFVNNSALVRTLGRTQVLSTGLAVDHTASGVEFSGTFVGEVKMMIRSTSAHAPYGAGVSSSYFTVYIDGVRQSTRFEVPDGTTTLTVASFATKGEHTIKILKQTENNYTLCDFMEIIFKGELHKAPADKNMLIEFVGDSLTCGMGNLPDASSGTYPSTPSVAQTSKYEDGTQSYGYLTTELLGADASIISEAAMGISQSWFDPMPDYYKATSYNRSKNDMYDFSSARVPDIVVINQGTNDAGFSVDVNKFKTDIKNFILYVREAYGENMPIVWVRNVVALDQTYVTAIEQAISELGGESAGIYICVVTANNAGAQGHPTAAAHAVNANELVAFLRQKNLVG